MYVATPFHKFCFYYQHLKIETRIIHIIILSFSYYHYKNVRINYFKNNIEIMTFVSVYNLEYCIACRSRIRCHLIHGLKSEYRMLSKTAVIHRSISNQTKAFKIHPEIDS